MATQQTLDQHFTQTKPKNQTAKSFYGKKDISPLKEYWACNAQQKQKVQTPTVKKLITFSSDESDSDSENNSRIKRPINGQDEKLESSPSKIKRLESKQSSKKKTKSPRGPRKQIKPETPSTRMSKLKVSEKEEVSSRKQLFPDKYQNARLAFHSSVPENMVARENEMEQLRNFVNDHIKNKSSGSIYISGPPGTGKTAGLMKIRNEISKNVQQIYINCTSFQSPTGIFAAITQELKLKVDKKDNKAALEAFFSKSTRRKQILLILDEIDNLECKNQSVLYTIFEWPSFPNSKLILIGISNTLDLTDRILPRLQARCEVKPDIIHFAPYTNEQIVSIIEDRLNQANVTDIFTSNALTLLAKKVSALSGDIRKTLDICRRLFEYAEAQRNSLVLEKTNGMDSQDNFVKVDIKEVIQILDQIYGGSQNIDEDENKFPLQQKVLLCSLMLLLNKGKHKEVTIDRLYTVYKKVCQKHKFNVVDTSDFVSLCLLIEAHGIIRIASKTNALLSKIFLEWDQKQLTAALSDKNLTYDIVNDYSCLN